MINVLKQITTLNDSDKIQMEPGIYPDIPFEKYLLIDAINSSTLKKALQYNPNVPDRQSISIPHMISDMEKEDTEVTPSMGFGTFGHAAKLEPLKLMARYVVMPRYELDEENLTAPCKGYPEGKPSTSKGTKYYELKVATFKEVNKGKKVVPQTWYDNMLAMLLSLNADDDARRMFDSDGEIELTIVWDDPDTGFRLKARIDKVARTLKLLPDLKTCCNIFEFSRQIKTYGYDISQAMYGDGWKIATGEWYQPALCVVESASPYSVAARSVAKRAIARGRRLYKCVLNQYRKYLEGGIACGFIAPDEWDLPDWVYPEEKLTIGGTEVGGTEITI